MRRKIHQFTLLFSSVLPTLPLMVLKLSLQGFGWHWELKLFLYLMLSTSSLAGKPSGKDRGWALLKVCSLVAKVETEQWFKAFRPLWTAWLEDSGVLGSQLLGLGNMRRFCWQSKHRLLRVHIRAFLELAMALPATWVSWHFRSWAREPPTLPWKQISDLLLYGTSHVPPHVA